MTECYVAIGSNLAQPVAQARHAIAALAGLADCRLRQTSSLYSSTPMGPADQPDYINAVVQLDTALAPLALLDRLQQLELHQGRLRHGDRWGPRTLDLDLLLYGDDIIAHPRLVVPHYGMAEREFVLYPLAEIAPGLMLPDGRALSSLLQNCPRRGLAIVVSADIVTAQDILPAAQHNSGQE